MKLRIAKKICWNDYHNRCHYSKETVQKAAKKFQPYNISDCIRKNKELKEQGSLIRVMPYLIKESVPIVIDSASHKLLETRYSKTTVNNDYFGKLNIE